MKRSCSTEPLINHDAKRILITCWAWLSFNMFRGHIVRCASCIEGLQRRCAVSSDGDTKIAEQDLVISSQEHVFWFDITMDYMVRVSILKSSSNLHYI